MTALFPKTKSSIFEVWSLTFDLFGKSFKQVWCFGLLHALNALWMPKVGAFFVGHGYLNIVLILYVLSSLLSLYIWGLIICRMYNVGNGNDLSHNEIESCVNRRYFSIVFYTILCCVVLLLVVGFGYGLSIIDFFSIRLTGMLKMLLGVVSLYLAAAIFLGGILVLLDKKNPINGFIGAAVLVWGNLWRTYVELFLFFAIFGLSWYFRVYIVGLRGLYTNVIIEIIFYFFAVLFMSPLTLVIFNDLKLRKEKDSVTAIIT